MKRIRNTACKDRIQLEWTCELSMASKLNKSYFSPAARQRRHRGNPGSLRGGPGNLQGNQLYMTCVSGFLVENVLVRYCLYTCTLDKSLFTRYQKNTALVNWSPCKTDSLKDGRAGKIFIVPS